MTSREGSGFEGDLAEELADVLSSVGRQLDAAARGDDASDAPAEAVAEALVRAAWARRLGEGRAPVPAQRAAAARAAAAVAASGTALSRLGSRAAAEVARAAEALHRSLGGAAAEGPGDERGWHIEVLTEQCDLASVQAAHAACGCGAGGHAAVAMLGHARRAFVAITPEPFRPAPAATPLELQRAAELLGSSAMLGALVRASRAISGLDRSALSEAEPDAMRAALVARGWIHDGVRKWPVDLSVTDEACYSLRRSGEVVAYANVPVRIGHNYAERVARWCAGAAEGGDMSPAEWLACALLGSQRAAPDVGRQSRRMEGADEAVDAVDRYAAELADTARRTRDQGVARVFAMYAAAVSQAASRARRPGGDAVPGPVDRAVLPPPLRFSYCNHRGSRSDRSVTPVRVWYGSTEHHPVAGWLLDAYDHDRLALRTFSIDAMVVAPYFDAGGGATA